jgi:hypothetical protein
MPPAGKNDPRDACGWEGIKVGAGAGADLQNCSEEFRGQFLGRVFRSLVSEQHSQQVFIFWRENEALRERDIDTSHVHSPFPFVAAVLDHDARPLPTMTGGKFDDSPSVRVRP